MKKLFLMIAFCFILIIPSMVLEQSQSTPREDTAHAATAPDACGRDTKVTTAINADADQNKINEFIETQLTTKNRVPVFVCYDSPPTAADITMLNGLGVESSYKCKYINAIVTTDIGLDEIQRITTLPVVNAIEPVPEVNPLLDISCRAVKARESEVYSPKTAWELGFTGKGINIAIFDSGVDDGHSTFNNKFVAGADFSMGGGRITPKDGSYNPDDTDGHGTSVAGIALGTGGRDGDYMGVAIDAGLIDVKVSGQVGGAMANAIDWCIDNKNTDWNDNGTDDYDGIDIISMSLGGGDFDSDGTDPTSQLLNSAVDAGLVVVVAIGNDGPDNSGMNSYAAADKVIAVGNLDILETIARDDDTIDPSSTRGPRRDDGDDDPYDELKPAVVAPGTGTTAPAYSRVGQRGNGYRWFGGSSASCPHVAGLCAILLEANAALNPTEIKKILRESSEAMGNPDLLELSDKYNYTYGFGSIDAYEAVKSALSFEPSNHKPEISSLTAKPKFVAPNDQVNITTTASDPDGDSLNYNYTTTGGEITGTGPEVTWTAPADLGEYEVTAVVNDGILFSDPAYTIITVETEPTNHAPIIENVEAAQTTLLPGESTEITVTAIDPDDDEIFYEYESTGGSLSGTGSTVTWTAPNTNGKYTITVTVNDGELHSDTERVIIEVEGGGENKPPVVESFTASERTVDTGDTVWLTVEASDPEKGVLQYSYQPTSGRILGAGTNVNWTAPDKPGGATIKVTVTDEGMLSDSAELFLEVIQPNLPPEIMKTDANPGSAISDGSVEVLFTVRVSDANGVADIAKVTIDLSRLLGSENQKMYDNGRHGDQARDDGVYSYSYLVPEDLKSGARKLPVSAQDWSGETVSDFISIEIIAGPEEEEAEEGFLPIPGFGVEAGVIAVMLIALILFSRKLRHPRRKQT